MITSKDFSSLTDDLQSIFNEQAKNSIADNVGFKVYRAFDTNRLTYDHLILHGLAGIQKVAEGQDLPSITGEEGDSVTYTQSYYGGIVPITKKMRKFDLHDQIESLVRSTTDDAFDKIDQSMADRLLGGWNAARYLDPFGDSPSSLGPDAVALFSASHSNNFNTNVCTNLISDSSSTTNPALSRDAISWTQSLGMIHRDPNDINRPINLDTLVVSPKYWDLAQRIVSSTQMSGTANNDINPLRGELKVIRWSRLDTNSAGDDTSAYWFMLDSKKVGESLKCLFAERPTLDAPDVVYSNKNWEYSIDFYYTLGTGYPLYIWGSDGSGN